MHVHCYQVLEINININYICVYRLVRNPMQRVCFFLVSDISPSYIYAEHMYDEPASDFGVHICH